MNLEYIVALVIAVGLGYFVYTRIKKANRNSGGTGGTGGGRGGEPRNPTDHR